jgi:hypothetical protein
MLRRVALVRTEVSEEHSVSFIRVTRIGELGTTLAATSSRRSVRRLLVAANVVPSPPILVILMKETLCSSETSDLTRATRRTVPEDTILHSHHRENLKSYKPQYFCSSAMRPVLRLWGCAVIVLCITAPEQGHQYKCRDITECNWNLLCPVTRLDCSNNAFGSLTAASFYPEENVRQLTELWLNKSGITSLEYNVFYHINSLKSLILRGNLLNSLDNRVFYSLIQLEYLDLSHNRLISVNSIELFEFQVNLKILLLGFNRLTTLTKMIFLRTIKLDYLDLSFNNLYALSDCMFSSQEHLVTLLLNSNKLTTINVTLLRPLRSIRQMELSENPLRFDCGLRPTVLWCKDMNLHIGAIFHNQKSEQASKWMTLESFENCSANKVDDVMFSVSANNVTDSEYISVSKSSLWLVALGILTFTGLQIICCGYMYFKMRQRFAVSAELEKVTSSDRSSNQIHDYDYITSPSMSKLPDIPARPTQTTPCQNGGNLPVRTAPEPEEPDPVQTADRPTRVDLKEPYLCIRNDLYAECL